jgi:glycosyltransferase involved in cell wall biosynthesis
MPQSSPPPRRPHILQVVSHLALGGAERVAITLMAALRNEFDFSLHAVRGIEPGGFGDALAREVRALKVPFTLGARVPMRLGGVITSGIGLTRVVRRLKPDLIHLHTEIPEAAYAAMVSWSPALRHIPVMRTIHNTVFWRFWRPLGRWCDRRMAHAYVAGVSPGCVSELMALRSESHAPPLPEPPRVIFNGVPELPRSSSKIFANDRPLKVVFGGRLEHEKGSDLLPNIIARARPRSGTADLTLYGSGAHEALLRRLVAVPPPGWTVRLEAPVTDFAARLDAFDLVLMPSRYEGLGLVAVEAAFAGVPVIATHAPGLRDAFPSTHPWLAKPDDASDFADKLQHALDHPETWSNAAAAAATFARERFSLPSMAAAYHALYRSALDNAKPAP